jgi:hypothetical protein
VDTNGDADVGDEDTDKYEVEADVRVGDGLVREVRGNGHKNCDACDCGSERVGESVDGGGNGTGSEGGGEGESVEVLLRGTGDVCAEVVIGASSYIEHLVDEDNDDVDDESDDDDDNGEPKSVRTVERGSEDVEDKESEEEVERGEE